MKDEYIIVNKTALEKKIAELKIISNTPYTSIYDVDVEGFIAEKLELLISQSIPLIPEIERAFNAGIVKSFSNKKHSHVRQDYISNLKLNI